MSYQDYMPLANVCQALTLVLSLLAYVPQWVTLYTTKSSRNVSLRSWVIWLISGLLAWVYAFVSYMATGNGIVLLVSSSAILGCIGGTIALLLRYRERSDSVPALQNLKEGEAHILRSAALLSELESSVTESAEARPATLGPSTLLADEDGWQDTTWTLTNVSSRYPYKI